MTTMPPQSQQHSVMERVLFQLHVRTCHFGLQLSTPARQLLEHLLLIVAIAGFGALIMLHRNFVSKAVCLDTIPNFNMSADLHHLTILPVSTNMTKSYVTTIRTSGDDTCQELDPTYSYSTTKAYVLLPTNHSLLQYVPHIQHIVVSPHDPQCFGEPFLQYIVHNVIGYDTIVWNWFLHGLLQTRRDEEDSVGYIASHGRCQELRVGPPSLMPLEKWISKVNVLIKTTFAFFFSTTLISFTLRETQERMLEFTRELTRRVSIQLPLVDLVVFHLIHNVVFVPIMVGMLFFLIEFYSGDRMLAFLVMTIVWCVEVFSVISLRSYQGITFFPWMFFLLFCLFHIYYFANPYGFAYTALIVNGLFMVHSMVFFWHRYELPAVALGRVTVDRPRLQWDDTSTTHPSSSSSANAPLIPGPEDHIGITTTTTTTGIGTPFVSPQQQQQPQQRLQQRHNNHQQRRPEHQEEEDTLAARPLLPPEGPMSPPSQPHRIHNLPMVEPQEHHLLFARHASFSSHNSSSRNSAAAPAGSGGIFRNANDDADDVDGDEDDESGYMYMLRGEVVVRRGVGQGASHIPILSSSSSTQRMEDLLEDNALLSEERQNTTTIVDDDHATTTTATMPSFLDIPRSVVATSDRVSSVHYSRDDSISGLQSILEVRLTPRPSHDLLPGRPRSSPPPTLPNLPS